MRARAEMVYVARTSGAEASTRPRRVATEALARAARLLRGSYGGRVPDGARTGGAPPSPATSKTPQPLAA